MQSRRSPGAVPVQSRDGAARAGLLFGSKTSAQDLEGLPSPLGPASSRAPPPFWAPSPLWAQSRLSLGPPPPGTRLLIQALPPLWPRLLYGPASPSGPHPRLLACGIYKGAFLPAAPRGALACPVVTHPGMHVKVKANHETRKEAAEGTNLVGCGQVPRAGTGASGFPGPVLQAAVHWGRGTGSGFAWFISTTFTKVVS